MKFEQFLTSAQDSNFWTGSICFKGDAYPLLFFTKLFEILSKKDLMDKSTFLSLDIDEISFLSLLNQSFLGQSVGYFLGEIKEFKDKKRKRLVSTIFNYEGLHRLMFFVSHDVKIANKKFQVVELENKIDKRLFKILLKFFGVNGLERKEKLVQAIFKRSPVITLESACRLSYYLKIVNPSFEKEFSHYLSFLLEPDKSFFTLSNYFFARNKEKFFKLWEELHNDYPPLFWVAFWAEQLWRACYVRKFLASKDILQAKRMSARLPFSYLKNYYRNYSSDELAREYGFLYRTDCALKSGSEFPALDLFYLKHFSKKFSST